MTLGSTIRAARERMGLTQARLADLVGVTTKTINNYETDKRMPDDEKRRKLAEALDIDSRILGVVDGPSLAPTIKVMGHTAAGHVVRIIEENLFISKPPGISEAAECVLLGDGSMHPFLPDGAALFFWRWEPEPVQYLGRLCVVELDDGRLFVRVLEKGDGLNLWTLAGWGSSPMRNVRIKRAAPVDFWAPFPKETLTVGSEPVA